jgi:hypothetical protein
MENWTRRKFFLATLAGTIFARAQKLLGAGHRANGASGNDSDIFLKCEWS